MSDDGFETTATLRIDVPDSELRNARQQIETSIGSASVGMTDGGTASAQAGGGGGGRQQRRARQSHRWERQRTEDIEDLLEEVRGLTGEEGGGIVDGVIGGLTGVGGDALGAGALTAAAAAMTGAAKAHTGAATALATAAAALGGSSVLDAIDSDDIDIDTDALEDIDGLESDGIAVKEPDWLPIEPPEEPEWLPIEVEDPGKVAYDGPETIPFDGPEKLPLEDVDPLPVEDVDPIPVEQVDPIVIRVEGTGSGESDDEVVQESVGDGPFIEERVEDDSPGLGERIVGGAATFGGVGAGIGAASGTPVGVGVGATGGGILGGTAGGISFGIDQIRGGDGGTRVIAGDETSSMGDRRADTAAGGSVTVDAPVDIGPIDISADLDQLRRDIMDSLERAVDDAVGDVERRVDNLERALN